MVINISNQYILTECAPAGNLSVKGIIESNTK